MATGTTKTTESARIEALAKYLEVDPQEVEPARYGENTFEVDDEEWLVLTDKEANQAAADYIADSVWAFRPSFIAAHSELDSDDVETICKALQDKCEGANKSIKALISDWNHFVDDAIKADGRGHFLSPYDGEEVELKCPSGRVEFFAYRLN